MYYLSLPARAGQKLRVRGQRNFPFFLKYFVYNADIYSIMSDMRKQALAWWRGLTWPEKCAIIQEHVSGDSVEMRTSVIDKSSIQIERVFRETQK